MGKQNSPRCNAAECGVPFGAIVRFLIFIEKWNENEKSLLIQMNRMCKCIRYKCVKNKEAHDENMSV